MLLMIAGYGFLPLSFANYFAVLQQLPFKAVVNLNLPREFHNEMEHFSRRDFAVVGSRQEALSWLVED
jgi:hypothetical protein